MDVGAWLRDLGLERYEASFRDNDIDTVVLPELTADDLSGEPGIGKSRLTASLPQHLSGQSYVRLQYFCSPHHQNTALYPVIGQLRRAAGLELDDSADEQLEKLRRVIRAGDVAADG